MGSEGDKAQSGIGHSQLIGKQNRHTTQSNPSFLLPPRYSTITSQLNMKAISVRRLKKNLIAVFDDIASEKFILD